MSLMVRVMGTERNGKMWIKVDEIPHTVAIMIRVMVSPAVIKLIFLRFIYVEADIDDISSNKRYLTFSLWMS